MSMELQAFSTIQSGYAQKAQYEARRDELAREAQLQETAANETQASNLLELQRSVGNIRAITAARGLNPDSPSAMAIEGGEQRVADTNNQRTAFNARQQSNSLKMAGKAAMMSGQAAVTGAYFKATGDALKTAATMGFG